MNQPSAVPAPPELTPVLPGPLALGSVVAAEPATLMDWLRLARYRQWVKNVLVAAAALAAGRWLVADTMTDTALAFVLFTITAAGCYMVNDVRDRVQDVVHPTKRFRPVAAGRIPPRTAAITGLVCATAAPALAMSSGYLALGSVLAAYAGITLLYSWRLKTVPYLEVAIVASGFVLRPLAGAAATRIPPSPWFLVVTCAGAVMVAAGKRGAERATASAGSWDRPSLRSYSAVGLRRTQAIAAGFLCVAYAGWAATRSAGELPFALLSLVAVVVAATRFVIRGRRGDAGAPEELLIHDRWLLGAAVAWMMLMLIGSLHA